MCGGIYANRCLLCLPHYAWNSLNTLSSSERRRVRFASVFSFRMNFRPHTYHCRLSTVRIRVRTAKIYSCACILIVGPCNTLHVCRRTSAITLPSHWSNSTQLLQPDERMCGKNVTKKAKQKKNKCVYSDFGSQNEHRIEHRTQTHTRLHVRRTAHTKRRTE